MDLKLAVVKKVERCFQDAEVFFEKTLERPRILFNIRGQDAGRAYFPIRRRSEKKISLELRFNEQLLEKNPEEFINKVVPHECAHLIVYELFGTHIRPHGEEWKVVMEGLFGVEAEVTHNFDTQDIVNKPFIYRCACSGNKIPFSARQHKQMQQGGKYICRSCKSEVQFLYQKPDMPKKKNSDRNKIKGLFIYTENKFIDFDEVLAARLAFVLNRKKPEQVYCSELFDEDAFYNWLKRQSLFKKYRGEMVLEDLPGYVEADSISHVILIVKTIDVISQENKDMLQSLSQQGLIIRSLRY